MPEYAQVLEHRGVRRFQKHVEGLAVPRRGEFDTCEIRRETQENRQLISIHIGGEAKSCCCRCRCKQLRVAGTSWYEGAVFEVETRHRKRAHVDHALVAVWHLQSTQEDIQSRSPAVTCGDEYRGSVQETCGDSADVTGNATSAREIDVREVGEDAGGDLHRGVVQERHGVLHWGRGGEVKERGCCGVYL